jgi:NADPH:quinone reductase-like Zn-dependent oxidoreductase
MKLLPNLLARRPQIAEHDFAGVIVDSNGTHFKNGDEVFGWISTGRLSPTEVDTLVLDYPSSVLSFKTGQGALGQFICVPADHIVSRPPNITPIQAAGVSLAGLTAYQALFHVAKLEADQTVFINGGSTAVGAFAIQLAKTAGARVTASASGKNEDFVRGLGADNFIDYTKVDLPKYLAEHPPGPKFNAVFDAVGSADPTLYTLSEAYLAPSGVFVTTNPFPQNASISQIWMFLKTIAAAVTPRWLGGTKRQYRCV